MSSTTLTATNATQVTGHQVMLTGLARGTTYSYRVSSRDAAGNTSVGPVATFVTRR